jgi:hypothetical protein
MQCEEFEAHRADDVTGPLSREARQHLEACSACRDLFADFSAIAVAAKHLPAEVNPPDRIWVAVRAQLEAEGIIRDRQFTEPAPAASWGDRFAQFFRPRVLGTVAAGLLVAVAGVYFMQHQTAPSNTAISKQVPVVAPEIKMDNKVRPDETAQTVKSEATRSATVTVTRHPSAHVSLPPQPQESHTVLASSPSESAYFGDSAAVLSQTENALPSRTLRNNATVDASMRQNLRTLNEFISECEARLKQNPQDQLTREYLNMAYQQKAELLTAMMDSGRSEQ